MKETGTEKSIVLGLMSGTSLDGLDLALCRFNAAENGYNFEILKSTTVNYDHDWRDRLRSAQNLSAQMYFELHSLYGRYIAEQVNHFLRDSPVQPQLIASHGHTVFHQAQKGFSTQLGCGATIAAKTGIATVCDFRSLDVANCGQGAPLVPIGDKLLFGKYSACLNIGGIANLSFDDNDGNRCAYDICEANLLLNHLSEKTGKAYDEGGNSARTGQIDQELFDQLNSLEYYQQQGAKSLGREWFEQHILPIIESTNVNTIDILATASKHIAYIVASELEHKKIKNVLITGGGALNTFLIEQIKSATSCELFIPNTQIINFKEALIFGFLGYLRTNNKINTLKSVTGANKDSIGGAFYLG